MYRTTALHDGLDVQKHVIKKMAINKATTKFTPWDSPSGRHTGTTWSMRRPNGTEVYEARTVRGGNRIVITKAWNGTTDYTPPRDLIKEKGMVIDFFKV